MQSISLKLTAFGSHSHSNDNRCPVLGLEESWPRQVGTSNDDFHRIGASSYEARAKASHDEAFPASLVIHRHEYISYAQSLDVAERSDVFKLFANSTLVTCLVRFTLPLPLLADRHTSFLH